jgi:broad specificity phosphatase PhoE
MRLYLVRHGRIDASEERFWGQRDISLSEVGRAQARRLGERLHGEAISAVYASDLVRAAETAALAAVMPATLCPELREMDFGQFSGLSYTEIKTRFPEAAPLLMTPPPGWCFPGGESLEEVAGRLASWIEKIKVRRETALVVAHGGSLKVLLCLLLELELGHWWQYRFDPASLSIVDWHPPGAILSQLNETAYLTSYKD